LETSALADSDPRIFARMRMPDGAPQRKVELAAIEDHFFRMHVLNRTHGDREVSGIFDIDDKRVAPHGAHGAEGLQPS